MIFVVCALVLLAAAAARLRKSSPFFSIVSMLCSAVAFITLYAAVGGDVAQDRAAYYSTYLNAETFTVSAFRDHVVDFIDGEALFQVFMGVLPKNLSEPFFAVLFMSCWMGGLALFLFMVWKRGLVSLDAMPLVLLCLFVDRLFIDLVFNTTQSSFAGLLFLSVLLLQAFGYVLPALLGLFLVHGRMTLLSILVLSVAFVMRSVRRVRLLPLAAVVAVTVFTLRLFDHDLLLQTGLALGLGEVRQILFLHLFRGVWLDFPLSLSMWAQVFLAAVLPMALLFSDYRPGKPFRLNLGSGGRLEYMKDVPATFFMDFLVVALAFTLFFFPEISLVQRLFILVVAGVPALLGEKKLELLAYLKVGIFLVSSLMHPLL